MFVVNDDLSIYATRGDIVCLNVSATDDRTGEPYEFQAGDILQMKIYAKKDAESVVLQKDFPVVAKTDTVGVFLTESDTRIGEVISKPVDYWYEVTLNPYTNPQTFIGYDEDGAKIFKLFPEGNEVEDEDEEITEEDIPVVDSDLSLLSARPVENRAIARAVALVRNDMELMDERLTGKIKENKKVGETVAEELAVERARIDNLVASPTPGDSELVDIRVGADGVTYESAGTATREQIGFLMDGLYGVHYERLLTPCDYEDGVSLNELGVPTTNDYTQYNSTCKIPVKKGTIVSVIGDHINRLCLYNSADEVITESYMGDDTAGKTATIHQDGFLRFTIVVQDGNDLNQPKKDVKVRVAQVNKNNLITPKDFGSEYLYEPSYNIGLVADSVVDEFGSVVANVGYYITDFIPVEPLDVLSVHYAVPVTGAFYDENKEWVQSIKSGASGVVPFTFGVPYNAVYARFNIKKDIADKYSVVYGEESKETPESGVVTPCFLRANNASEWAGATFCTFGDSITWQDGKEYSQGDVGAIARGYQTVIKEKCGFASHDNYGVSGAPMASGSANGDGTVDTISKTDFTDKNYDLVIIAVGTNDFKLNVPIGEIDNEDTKTFCGAYCESIKTIFLANAKSRVVLLTPLHRDNDGYDDDFVNNAGHKLVDYVNAVRAIGEKYSLPVCDMYASSGINALNLSVYTMDGLHPNDAGYARMGEYCSAYINTI